MRSKWVQEPKMAGMEQNSAGLSPDLHREHPPPPPPYFLCICELYRIHGLKGIGRKPGETRLYVDNFAFHVENRELNLFIIRHSEKSLHARDHRSSRPLRRN